MDIGDYFDTNTCSVKEWSIPNNHITRIILFVLRKEGKWHCPL